MGAVLDLKPKLTVKRWKDYVLSSRHVDCPICAKQIAEQCARLEGRLQRAYYRVMKASVGMTQNLGWIE